MYFLGSKIDPILDDGRSYFLQNMWYSQSLQQYAWLQLREAASIDTLSVDFNGAEYLSDGYAVVAWLSGESNSLIETVNAGWDQPPFSQ